MGLPLSNDGKPVASQVASAFGLIPKGAKNVEVAKDFLKYIIQPKVNNELLKTGLGPQHAVHAVDRQGRPVVARPQGPASGGLRHARPARPDRAGILGLQSGLCAGPERACLEHGVDRHHDRWSNATGGGGEGLQTGRGDFREIHDPRELRTHHEQRVGHQSSAATRRSLEGDCSRYWRGSLQGSEFTWAVAFSYPYIAVFLTFVAYPVLYGVWMGSSPHLYAELFSDPIYQETVVNTLLFLAFGVNLKLFLALLLSGFFMRPGWWTKALLMVFVLPWAVPALPTFISHPLDAERRVGPAQQRIVHPVRHRGAVLAQRALARPRLGDLSRISGNGCRSGP